MWFKLAYGSFRSWAKSINQKLKSCQDSFSQRWYIRNKMPHEKLRIRKRSAVTIPTWNTWLLKSAGNELLRLGKVKSCVSAFLCHFITVRIASLLSLCCPRAHVVSLSLYLPAFWALDIYYFGCSSAPRLPHLQSSFVLNKCVGNGTSCVWVQLFLVLLAQTWLPPF